MARDLFVAFAGACCLEDNEEGPLVCDGGGGGITLDSIGGNDGIPLDSGAIGGVSLDGGASGVVSLGSKASEGVSLDSQASGGVLLGRGADKELTLSGRGKADLSLDSDCHLSSLQPMSDGGGGPLLDGGASKLAAHFLAHFGQLSHCAMRTMRYPGSQDAELRAQAGALAGVSSASRSSKVTAVGISEHTDFECFTLLHQTAEGLELKDTAGNWRAAGVYKDRSLFTVIVADMMERWTNGKLRATPHRVAFTPHERLSLVRFNGLDPDAVVAPLPQFLGASTGGLSLARDRQTGASQPISNAGRDGGGARYAATTQGEHTAAAVTRASKNLDDMLADVTRNITRSGKRQKKDPQGTGYPKRSLTPAPRHMAQLLVLRHGKVLLGRHVSGAFEGRWTGFIEEVEAGEDPMEAAIRALALGGMRLDFDGDREENEDTTAQDADRGPTKLNAAAAAAAAVTSNDQMCPSSDKISSPTTASGRLRRCGGVVGLVERARLRFTGWLDVPVIEHEFTCQLDGDDLEVDVRGIGGGAGGGVRLLKSAHGNAGLTLVGAPPLDDAPPPPPSPLRGDAQPHTHATSTHLNGHGDGTGDEVVAGGGASPSKPALAAMVPKWFDEGDVPYREMPDDDQHWYPLVLALAAKGNSEGEVLKLTGEGGGGGVGSSDGGSVGSGDGGLSLDDSRRLSASQPIRGGGSHEASTALAGWRWEVAREIIVGDFHFEDDELASHRLRTIVTDA